MHTLRSATGVMQSIAGPSSYLRTVQSYCRQCRDHAKSLKRDLHASSSAHYASPPGPARSPALRTRPGYLALDTGMAPPKPRPTIQPDIDALRPKSRSIIPGATPFRSSRGPTPSAAPQYGMRSPGAPISNRNTRPTMHSPASSPVEPHNTASHLLNPQRRDMTDRSTHTPRSNASIPSPIPSPTEISRFVASTNLAEIPSKINKHRKIGFTSLDLALVVGPINTRRLPTYHCPLFVLRACPTHLLPKQNPPPFPSKFLRKRTEDKIIRMGMVASKAAVSKLAVERNLAKRRMKSAVELVLERGVGVGGEDMGVGFVSDEHTYVISLKAEMVNVPFDQVVVHAARGFVEIKKAVMAGFDFGSKYKFNSRR